ncbi:radical SAM protein [Candidatus Micrarchaeota archaeon]|nr:radical SAM protein [Candidatus Micrarchaeota archaeon]
MIIKTKSVCPECKKVIDAELFEKDGIIFMRKTCPTHGEFIERITDIKTFERDHNYLKLLYKYIPSSDIPECPHSCETCTTHKSPIVLGIIDVTNRCNLRCSYCFANAAVSGWLFEPKFETIKKEIDFLVNQDPPAPAVLFSGGEPTMREDFPELVKYANNKGLFVLVATNGYNIASSLEYTKRLGDSGVSIIYLSFDGLTNETNTEKKNHLIIDKIIDHCRQTNIGIVLVPTIIRGLNDNQIWPIIKFASQHMDVIRGVNFQPISFCGRMNKEQREKQRFTISDLKSTLEKQSQGVIKGKEWYPVPTVLPFTKLFEGITGNKAITFSSHPLCGEATYLFKDDEGNLIPVPEFVDVDKFMSIIEKHADEIKNANKLSKSVKLLSLLNELLSTINFDKIPRNLKFKDLLKNVILNPGDMNALTEFHSRALFIGAMHFQDLYNLDIERLKYCPIHYVTPDLTRIPFCAYNGDLGYRERVEKRHRRQFTHKNG